MRLHRLILAALLPLAACEDLVGPGDPDAPANLAYQLIPSGDPNAPLGVLLTWDVPRSGRANSFNVYARTNGAQWALRATTTSPTFHDAGTPEAQYYVATRDERGEEIAHSNVVTVDLQSRLPAPQGIGSISLDGAVQLFWASNSVDASRATFDHYLVYSTGYDGNRGVCTSDWSLEGSTVSDGFLVGNLTNGVSRCYAISAITHDGHESQWSEARLDTPRPDGRSTVVYARQARTDSAGFFFTDSITKKLGQVGASDRTDADFTIERRSDGTLWLTPARSGVTIASYSSAPIIDLSSIDRAPASGFSSTALQAIPAQGYVFRMQKADGVHFGAVRVAYTAANYLVLDWSYQTAIGNPELNRRP
jgi:hypothetical protein